MAALIVVVQEDNCMVYCLRIVNRNPNTPFILAIMYQLT